MSANDNCHVLFISIVDTYLKENNYDYDSSRCVYAKLFNVQSHYSVWHKRMRAYASVCSYARMRWYTLGVRKVYVLYALNTLTYVGVRCVLHRDQTLLMCYSYDCKDVIDRRDLKPRMLCVYVVFSDIYIYTVITLSGICIRNT